MSQLTSGIIALGLTYIPSVANFITIDLGRPASPIYQALLRMGCITRLLGTYNLFQHLRVTIGLPEENARFLDALEQVLQQS